MSVVDDVLNYKPSEDEDFYALLGCDESASVSYILFIVIRPSFCAYSLLRDTVLYRGREMIGALSCVIEFIYAPPVVAHTEGLRIAFLSTARISSTFFTWALGHVILSL